MKHVVTVLCHGPYCSPQIYQQTERHGGAKVCLSQGVQQSNRYSKCEKPVISYPVIVVICVAQSPQFQIVNVDHKDTTQDVVSMALETLGVKVWCFALWLLINQA